MNQCTRRAIQDLLYTPWLTARDGREHILNAVRDAQRGVLESTRTEGSTRPRIGP
jgi:hypothetical protein